MLATVGREAAVPEAAKRPDGVALGLAKLPGVRVNDEGSTSLRVYT